PPALVRVDQHQLADQGGLGEPGYPVDQFRGVGGPAPDDRDLHPNARTSAPARATWQAAACCGASSASSGVTWWHSSMASGQRQRNRQPGVGSMTLGGSPRPVSAVTSSGARGSGTADSSSWVYGCRGLASTSSTGPDSAICPAYMTISRSATYRALAMSWVMERMDTPSSSRSLAIRLSSPIRIDTSSIETGSSARISLGFMASAWAKPTRCRWPPL